jgi:hypothetical protein
MSHTYKKKDSHEYPEKDHVLTELGDIVASREAIGPEEDRRILRKIDLK